MLCACLDTIRVTSILTVRLRGTREFRRTHLRVAPRCVCEAGTHNFTSHTAHELDRPHQLRWWGPIVDRYPCVFAPVVRRTRSMHTTHPRLRQTAQQVQWKDQGEEDDDRH